jgi:putative spermidine/putrescine transport system ATP-binding protein
LTILRKRAGDRPVGPSPSEPDKNKKDEVSTVERQPQLRAIGIGKRYGDFRALDEVSIDIRQGEFLTLLGPSGSGKTTFLMILAGFGTPPAGASSGARTSPAPGGKAQLRHGVPGLRVVPA